MSTSPIRFYPHLPTPGVSAIAPRRKRGDFLKRAGLFLRHHRNLIIAMQWCVVLFYGSLVIIPAFLPLPSSGAHIWNNLRLFAQFVFWGLWWPGVMLATVALGRVWCGLFCPEGFLSELASRHGRGKTAPGWLKWSGWPFLAFVTTTVYGQLISVYEYAEAALLILGGSTAVAVTIGLLYGKDKRIWCRYLCPASGVFAVLAKIAPLHYKVDREKWDRTPATPEKFNCPPLVDVRRMASASNCHACGHCAGQRDAVELALRSPATEILDTSVRARTHEALTLLFGILGIATFAFQWTVNPWFVQLKMALATWLVEHDHFTLLTDNAPWWLLTHYPDANDVFTWLDGLMVLAYILVGGLLLGAALLLGPLTATVFARKFAPKPAIVPLWQRFTFTLAPLAAVSVILGLTMTTATQLRGEHLLLTWLPAARAIFLTLGGAGSLWLAFALTRKCLVTRIARLGAFIAMCWPVALMACLWWMVFFVW